MLQKQTTRIRIRFTDSSSSFDWCFTTSFIFIEWQTIVFQTVVILWQFVVVVIVIVIGFRRLKWIINGMLVRVSFHSFCDIR